MQDRVIARRAMLCGFAIGAVSMLVAGSAFASVGPGNGGISGGGGGGGGGGGTTISNPFLGATWTVIVGDAIANIQFNSNGSFTMTVTSDVTGQQIAIIRGNYSMAATSTSTATVPQFLLTMTSQGSTVLFGLATFKSPDNIIFGVGTQNIPDSGLPSDEPSEIFLVRGT